MPPPLVTLAVPSFNQAQFVREALEGVFSQTYSPLEIIIADDASTDGTPAILREAVKSYRGPHTVQLHCFKDRKGVENYNRLMDCSRGEFIVVAHTDDIAHPDRVEALTDAWKSHNVSLVSSNAHQISADGEDLGLAVTDSADRTIDTEYLATQNWFAGLRGSGLAWERAVFEKFGPLKAISSAVCTDWILPFRAALLRGVHYLGRPLLKCRSHRQSRENQLLQRLEQGRIAEESDRANHITQYSYMLETLLEFRASHGDSPQLARTEQDLCGKLREECRNWAAVRNSLLHDRWRCAWNPVDEAGSRPTPTNS